MSDTTTDEAKAAVELAEAALENARRVAAEARRKELEEGLTDAEREFAKRARIDPAEYATWKGVLTGDDAEQAQAELDELRQGK